LTINEDLLVLVYFISLFGTVMFWLVLTKLLFNQLLYAHPEKYESMGRPTLQDGGTNVQQTFSLIKYLAFREYLPLNDPYLSRISNIMRALLIGLPIYFVCSTALIITNL
jgi:hypothetical protein